MKPWLIPTIALLASMLATGCTPREYTGAGFVLPPGDGVSGKATFVQLGCNECHTVSGVDLAAPTDPPETMVMLGGDVTKVRSYGDLVTSIIHPSQRISDLMHVKTGERPSESPMPNVNETMTVAQLVDLATFLQPRYHKFVSPTQWTTVP